MPSITPTNMLKTRLFRKPRFVPLRVRFILLITVTLVLIISVLAVILGLQQKYTIRRQMEERGLAVAQSLAATSLTNLMIYNYVALESSAYQAAQDPDISYVIFHDKEGRVAGHSNRPDFQNKLLDDPISRKAITSDRSLIQEIYDDSGRQSGLDVMVPAYPTKIHERWGTVRVGLTLAAMYKQIRQIQLVIFSVGLVALICGVLISLWMAQRITKPLDNLVAVTQAAARGDLTQEIDVRTADEVEVLAANFKTMIAEILAHREQLENRLVEIQRLQRYAERLLTTMSDGLLSVDMQGKISTINPAAHQILDLENQPVLKGDDIRTALIHFPELRAFIEHVGRAPGDYAPREIGLNGSVRTRIVLVGCGILKDRLGHPREIIINLHDITELKALEASMRQAERLAALGTLAAGMAHEIRNPLSAIKTFVQLLPRKLAKPGFLEKFNRTVPRELERINQLVEDLLDLARKPAYKFEQEDIGQVILQRLDLLDEELQMRHINCDCLIPDNLPMVRIDSDQISKAFHNLIKNAAQAMPAGGSLSIEVSLDAPHPPNEDHTGLDNAWLTIIFADTGPGIDPEELKSIFNPFFTTKDCGTGLGLSITHKVVTEHGGHIDVQSRPGEGTRFRIKLPVSLSSYPHAAQIPV